MGEFGGELTRWMQARDTGVRELARRSGYTASYISQLRAGKRMPSPEAAADLDDALSAGGALASSAPAPARGRQAVRPASAATGIAAILSALPGDDQPGRGVLREQEYDHLVQALAQWAAQMKRRDVLALLGAAATAACASPLLDRLSPDDLARMASAAAGTRRADPAVAAHAEAVLEHCMRQEDTLGPQVVLDTVLAQQRLVTALLALATAGQSLAAADPAFVRNVALTRLAQARAYAQMGEPGKACEQISDAADLACQNNSPRLIRMLAQTRQQLRPWATTPDVASLDERLHVLGLTA